MPACANCKKDFIIEPEDSAFYEKIKVPPPTWCSHCRMIRRFLFRNERHAYMRPDAHSGKLMFSGMPPRLKTPVYNVEYWRSDDWDPMEYGRDYDSSKPFFEQFRELWYGVPWPGQSVLSMVNSEYCDQAGYFKNAYLCFNGDAVEDSAYTFRSSYIKDSFDLTECGKCELCYGSVAIGDSSRVFFSVDCDKCENVWFSRDMAGCSNCFGCVNLRGKSYHFFNQPLTKVEYEKKVATYLDGTRRGLLHALRDAEEFWGTYPVKFMRGIRNVQSSGEMIYDTKNVNLSHGVHGGENIKYSQQVIDNGKDCYDYTVWGNVASWVYESVTCGEQIDHVKFCFDCWPSIRNAEYSVFCRSSSDIFGCVGLKKKQYCILNKQYSKEEYLALKDRIIEQMKLMPYVDRQGRKYGYGEFFPPELSPFAYNETITQDFFPSTKEEALSHGYAWQDPEAKEYQTTKNAAELPDAIGDVSEDILKEVIKCEECGKAYRIIPRELEFYRRMKLPLPRACVNCRFDRRFAHLNPPSFREASCMCGGSGAEEYSNTTKHFHGEDPCPRVFKTAYRTEQGAIIYCEECYQAETA